MRIYKAVLRNFKRFEEETFRLEGNVVLAGPNNSGKTTLLQAIYAWSLALARWHELGDFQRRRGGYTKKNIAREQFYSVPLRAFDLLWHDRKYKNNRIEIEVTTDIGNIPMELLSDTDLQIYTRPLGKADQDVLKESKYFPKLAFVPAMSGLEIDEPVLQQPRIDQLLGFGKPGDVLRNLLVQVGHKPDAWKCLAEAIEDIFGYELLVPASDGPIIIAEYRERKNGPKFDVNGAGSGFLQMLMLLAFLCTQKETVLLLDAPDAHLHMILQDTIYSTLRKVAQERDTQLLIATHSRIVINSAEPRELCSLAGHPKRLADNNEKSALIKTLSIPNTDIILAREKGRVIYTEGHTDLAILRAWADALDHKVKDFLQRPLWRPTVYEVRGNAPGVPARNHFRALQTMTDDLLGVEIVDRDGKEGLPTSKLRCEKKLLRLCWARYEIESYLVHPAALARFVRETLGENAPLAEVGAVKKALLGYLPLPAIDDPLGDHDSFKITKARTKILERFLDEAGMQGLEYSRYSDIASIMRPEEIHPDIPQVFDAVAKHLKL